VHLYLRKKIDMCELPAYFTEVIYLGGCCM